MGNYTVQVNWAGKDALSDSDPEKVISGSDFNTEFQEIASRIAEKAELNGSASESFSATTATAGTNTTQVATTAFVTTAVDAVDPNDILDDCTATAEELNILDGCTATTAELNLLDGAQQPVLQVISTTDNTHYSTTSSTLTNSGISVSITPSSTSSKILVLATVSTGFSVNSGAGVAFGLRRESTDLGQGTSGGNRRAAIAGTGYIDNSDLTSVSLSYLDSPSTTDETTYHITYSGWGSYTAYINRSGSDTDNVFTVRGSTTLTLMEVAG